MTSKNLFTTNNNTTHIHTEFLKMNIESTQKEILAAVGSNGTGIASIDTKLDTLNTTIIDKHISETTDTVTIFGSNYDTVAPANNAVYVDENGFLTANLSTIVHENIYIGYKNNIDALTFLTSGSATWNPTNTVALADDGFFYTSTGVSSGSIMMYNNGAYGATIFPSQSDVLISDMDTIYIIFKNYKPTTQSNVYINVYTKATGSGDYSPNYKSKFVYSLAAGEFLGAGVSYMFYHGLLVRVKNNDMECPRRLYEYNDGMSLGPRANSETISHIELSILDPSGLLLHECLLVEFGIYVKQKGLINYYYTSDNKGLAELASIETNTYFTEITKTSDILLGTTSLDVAVKNWPASTTISGTVSVSNFPATQPVTGTFWQATQPISGAVSVSNFPATQPVSISGTVATTVGMNKQGSLTNMANNITINSGSSTSLINIATYGKCLITYQDNNYSSLNQIGIWGTIQATSPLNVLICKLNPTKQANTLYRYAYAYLDLSPFYEIKLYNESSEPFTGVICTVLGG